MSYVPSPNVTTRIGSIGKFKHSKRLIHRIKQIEVEPIDVVERESLDNKFRASFLNSLFDNRTPNYSKQEIINILEKER